LLHLLEQQSLALLQAPFTALQLHVPFLQLPEQQLLSLLQPEPVLPHVQVLFLQV
jgi:hypothetical protein